MIYKNLFMSFKPKFFDVITTNVFAIQELIDGHYIAATYVATRPCMISTFFLLICNITLFFKYCPTDGETEAQGEEAAYSPHLPQPSPAGMWRGK